MAPRAGGVERDGQDGSRSASGTEESSFRDDDNSFKAARRYFDAAGLPEGPALSAPASSEVASSGGTDQAAVATARAAPSSPLALGTGTEEAAAALTGRTGTPKYMAPEVFRQEKYDTSCDVYSFAIILCEARLVPELRLRS